MQRQASFAQAEYAQKKKQTRRDKFLAEMETVVPWARLVERLLPLYPKGERGRPPIGLERMLRLYFLQRWYGLADEALEDALYDSQALRSFAGIELNRDPVPDATTVLHFRHWLEQHKLTEALFVEISALLAERGLLMRQGTIVDATIIGAQASNEPTFTTAARLQINALLADTMTSGAIVYVRSPNGNWLESFGTAVRGTNTPISTAAHFRVGSVTKTWTGTVILQLVQEGKLNLSDHVSRYIANVPDGSSITIEHLLTMRSGLYNYSTNLAFNQTLDSEPNKLWTTAELLAIAFSQPVYFAPGADFRYSNTNTVLLGMIIEQLTGMSAAGAIKTRLFAPLGLTDTFLPPQDNTSLPAPAPHGYQWGTNAETAGSEALSPARQTAAKNGTLRPTDVTGVSTSWGWTAGSGISTVKELAAYARRLVGGGYLKADLQAQRLASCRSTQPSNPTAASYCLGLAKFGTFYGHTGEIPGFNTFMGYDPTTQTTIVTCATTAAAPDGRAPANTIVQILIAELNKQGHQSTK